MLKLVNLNLVLVGVALAYPSYKSLIPNGYSVPNPCGGGNWRGVGHTKEGGTGPLNQFGVDFAANGHVWDSALCLMDSDGDGRTNGEELGDSHCHWSVISGGRISSANGHPGICKPLGSGACAGSAFTC